MFPFTFLSLQVDADMEGYNNMSNVISMPSKLRKYEIWKFYAIDSTSFGRRLWGKMCMFFVEFSTWSLRKLTVSALVILCRYVIYRIPKIGAPMVCTF